MDGLHSAVSVYYPGRLEPCELHVTGDNERTSISSDHAGVGYSAYFFAKVALASVNNVFENEGHKRRNQTGAKLK